jgi:hypothetical protein
LEGSVKESLQAVAFTAVAFTAGYRAEQIRTLIREQSHTEAP